MDDIKRRLYANQLTRERFVAMFNWRNVERNLSAVTRNRGDVVSWLREFIQEIETEEERSDILKFITGSRAAAFDRSIRVINTLSAIKL